MKCEHNWRVVFDGPHKKVLKCDNCLQTSITRKDQKMRRPVEDKMMRPMENKNRGEIEVRHYDTRQSEGGKAETIEANEN